MSACEHRMEFGDHCQGCWDDLRAELARVRAERDEAKREWESACERLRADPYNAKDWQECGAKVERVAELERENERLRTIITEFADMADDSGWSHTAQELRRRAALTPAAVDEGAE